MTFQCPYCRGLGFHFLERGCSLTYICEDCGGSGELAECDFCERVHPAYEIDENGRCPECTEEEQARIEKEELEENEKGNIA